VAKRGARVPQIALNEALDIPQLKSVALILLDDVLQRLAEPDERQCRIIELQFFASLSIEDTSEALGLSPATVSCEWTREPHDPERWLQVKIVLGEA
jgi:DNA-directed RNA polymerase specialized sigma24 family protein